jgi:hypothetical protein
MRMCHAGMSMLVSRHQAFRRVATEWTLTFFPSAFEDIGRDVDWHNDQNYVKVRSRASLSKIA